MDTLASTLIQLTVTGRDIPALPKAFPTLRDACDTRAKELAALPCDELLVLLSGGADSTLAAVALSRPASAAGKRVVYAVTPSGLKDLDPRTRQWLLAAEGSSISMFDGGKLDAYAGGAVITGVFGDELYDGWLAVLRPGLADRVWNMQPSSLISEFSGFRESAAVTDRFMPVFEGMPYPLSAPNMLHWLGFKYTWGREAYTFTVSTTLGAPGHRHFHFFDSIKHQQWMMQDMEVRCGRYAHNRKDVGIKLIQEYVGEPVNVPQKNAIMGEIVSGMPVLFGVLRIDSDGKIYRKADYAS